ncbi:hypothetical protein DFH28DRAFT_1184819 [Melampsora americana]|nr:hypothetical protein DFH28DRAFT_1184819 [Melampsora americana]
MPSHRRTTFYKVFKDYPANRHLIKENTREIDLEQAVGRGVSFDFGYGVNRGPVELETLKRDEENLKVIGDILKSVTPESIQKLRWQIGHFATSYYAPFGLFEPDDHNFAILARNLLQTISTFTNLTNLQYISDDVSSTFEDEISKTAELLPNLEILVIARPWSIAEGWNSFDPYDEEVSAVKMSKLIGKRLSSLTKLKRLHLQGLEAPCASWGQLNWKSPLEYLKVAECTYLYGLAVFPFASAFRKSLLGLSIGANQPKDPKDFKSPPWQLGKEFVVLEELQVRGDLSTNCNKENPRLKTRFLDEISQAPKLKHLEIYFGCSRHVLPHIKKGIEKSDPVWPSLQTIVAAHSDNTTHSFFPHSEQPFPFEEYRVSQKQITLEFGLLHAEWQQEEKKRECFFGYCSMGKMTFPNGRVIHVNLWARTCP